MSRSQRRRAKMKPVSPEFIDLVETKIRPMLEKEKLENTFSKGTKIVTDIFDTLEVEGYKVHPLVKQRRSQIVLFAKRKRR